MSLKTFHIFFIGVSILLSFGFGLWLLRMYTGDGNVYTLAMGISSFIAGAGLILYAIRFLRKLRHVSYL